MLLLIAAMALGALPALARAHCDSSPFEAYIAELMASHPEQGRPSLSCDPLLERVARERAKDMAARAYTSHVNPDGLGPNAVLSRAGYALPKWWNRSDRRRNSVEVIAWGFDSPDKAWKWWLQSPRHRVQVLGREEFWRRQTSYGVGYFRDPDSRYRHYWVILTAPPPAG